jgi:2'-5' RNA ligase
MKNDKELYFIALVPDEPVYSEIWQLKEEIRDRFASKAALRSPPHITLHMPFKWPSKKEALLGSTLQAVAEEQEPFIITLNKFGAFEPRVIYVGVEESAELTGLQKTIATQAAAVWHIYPMSGGRPFRPHMTIAFRDLKKPKFYEAWQEFKERPYQNTMPVRKICLLKHNGKHWFEDKHFALNKKVQQ